MIGNMSALEFCCCVLLLHKIGRDECKCGELLNCKNITILHGFYDKAITCEFSKLLARIMLEINFFLLLKGLGMTTGVT
jgi:hypothetical protein